MVNGEPVEKRQCYPIGGGGELTEHNCLAVVAERGVRRYGRRGRLGLDADAVRLPGGLAEAEHPIRFYEDSGGFVAVGQHVRSWSTAHVGSPPRHDTAIPLPRNAVVSAAV